MNEENITKSERIAAKIIRILAIMGAVTFISLIVWFSIFAFNYFLHKNEEKLTIETQTPALNERIEFVSTPTLLPVQQPTTFSWHYLGAAEAPHTFDFTFSCGSSITLRVIEQGALKEISCNTPYTISQQEVTLFAENATKQFTDIEIRVSARDVHDAAIITVQDDTKKLDLATTTTAFVASSTTVTNTETTKPTSTITPVVSQPVVVSQYTGPSDLVIEIEKTGILKESSGKDVFVKTSPIPSDKTAAIVFTVTNKGGVTSGKWRFSATLPTKDDATYSYTSPMQQSLLSGMQMQYTLSFDEVRDTKSGTITLTLDPIADTDKISNNVDSVKITID